MRLLLIYPAIGRKPGQPFIRSWQLQPLAIARLAAMTPPDWHITFMDDRVEDIDYAAPADLVAISIETFTARRGYHIARRFRARGIPVVFGGYHATLCPDEARQHADAICIGEAEGLWEQILRDTARRTLQPVYRHPPSPSRPPLTGLACDRTLFKGKNYLPVALVETSRGCPFRCNFCSITAAYQNTYRRRPATEIATEIAASHAKTIFFVDDNIVGDQNGALKLFEAITPLKIHWISQASLHALRDENFVAAMARSGCLGILIGFESLAPRTLASMGKRANHIDDYRATVRRLRRAGISIYGAFVFGYPDDTPDIFDKTLRFAKESRFFLSAFNHLIPFPGTPLYDEFLAAGTLPADTPWWLDENYRFGQVPFTPAQGMSAREIEQNCERIRRSFYSIPSALHRGIDFRCNTRTLGKTLTFWHLNLLLRKELTQKKGIPLAGAPDPAEGGGIKN
jgi:radical SAM superfamily enzyme YgiQ (UPF0313 family)